MRGRKPKPTELRRIAGNPGKRPLNDGEPQPRRVMPRCPRGLPDAVKKEWRRLAPRLFEMGVLTEADDIALAQLCILWARLQEAERRIVETNLILRTSNGNYVQNPLVGISNTAIRELRALLAEFGMTPSSRSRLKVSARENKSLAELLFEQAANERGG